MTVVAVMIGRAGSTGFPGKNLVPVLGRPMAAYPLIAAKESRWTDRVYVSTDSPEIAAIGREYGATIIDRPAHLATTAALGEHAFLHAHETISGWLSKNSDTVELLVLLMANAPTISGKLIDRGIEILRADPALDSAVSTSVYNMWSPPRARRLMADGTLQPFIPFDAYPDTSSINCDRDSQGDVYFADMGVSIVRPRCLENLESGLLPQKWMGRRIAPIKSSGGCDVDYEWQIPMVEHWLLANGVKPLSQ